MSSAAANASSMARQQSMREALGEGYFEKDRGYDRRVYENTVGNYLFIISIFMVFYLVVGIYWWGLLELGTK
jgi:amino acid permease